MGLAGLISLYVAQTSQLGISSDSACRGSGLPGSISTLRLCDTAVAIIHVHSLF